MAGNIGVYCMMYFGLLLVSSKTFPTGSQRFMDKNCSRSDLLTRRPLTIGIFSATRLLQKNGEGEVRTHDQLAGEQKKQAPARLRTHDFVSANCAMVTSWRY